MTTNLAPPNPPSPSSKHVEPSPSINKAKAQLRSLERKYRRFQSTLSLPQVLETEQQIKTMRDQLQKLKEKSHRKTKENAQWFHKYKAVRFTERVKTVRRIKKLEREGSSSSLIQNALLDLCYLMHFPAGKEYISLYPTEPHSAERLALQAQYRASIQKQIDEGELDLEALYQSCVHPKGPKKKTKGKQRTQAFFEKKLRAKQLRGEFLPSSSENESGEEEDQDS